ncbi:hypothetical protein ACI2KH_24335 [Roseomonas mucosa]|jgi:hypothetical protein|uniref:hypothetical protein n=1 Tax=Roseomonas mucosa TaxID=207340 RepID=UPI00384F8337
MRDTTLAHSTAAVLAVAPAMRRLLDEALNIFCEQFEEDEPVSGATSWIGSRAGAGRPVPC